MKFTKKEMMNAFLIFLDDALPNVECQKIKNEGNAGCHRRCDLCMMGQYIKKVRDCEAPKVARENSGCDYPTIE